MSSGPAEQPAREEADPFSPAGPTEIPTGPVSSEPPSGLEAAAQTSPLATREAAVEGGDTAPPQEQEMTSEAGPREPATHRRKKRKPAHLLTELPALLVIAFLLALLIKSFLMQAFYIPSESMLPTLHVGDRVLVNKVVYHLHPPRRGDIIVFSDPHPPPQTHRSPLSAFWHWLTEGFGVSTSPEKDFIKRVIALPGETIEIKAGQVYIDGKALHEPYLSPIKDVRDYPPTLVSPHMLFVMGDNRTNSNDSRFGLGEIPYGKVIGRAFVIIWPPSRIGWLHGL